MKRSSESVLLFFPWVISQGWFEISLFEFLLPDALLFYLGLTEAANPEARADAMGSSVEKGDGGNETRRTLRKTENGGFPGSP